MEPAFFATPEEFRAWLEANHETESELLVGFHKKETGRPTMTWSESVDQALCFGWIDGVRRRIDDAAYSIRFTPRKARSTWSRVNLAKVAALSEAGLMRPAGLRAFEARTAGNSENYAYEQQAEPELDPAQARELAANARAREWFEAQPPGYRRIAIHWITSAKRPETRARRLAQLIDDSAHERRIPSQRRAR